MISQEILESDLLRYTITHSSFDEHRDYIGLSHISETIEDIIKAYKQPQTVDNFVYLKCYKGYQMERDVVHRLGEIYGDRLAIFGEITAFNGLVRGHPDCWLDGFPVDIKSVLMNDWIPRDKLPRKVYWQMQGYLLYSGSEKCYVIYESREMGAIKVFSVFPNASIQNEIKEKLEQIIKIINKE